MLNASVAIVMALNGSAISLGSALGSGLGGGEGLGRCHALSLRATDSYV